MLAYAPQALQILASCLAAPLPRAREQALDAFTAWLKLTGGVGLTGPMLMQSPLVRCAHAEWQLVGAVGGLARRLQGASLQPRPCPAGRGGRPPAAPRHRWPLAARAKPHAALARPRARRRAALEGLRSPDTFFPAVDASVELIYCTSSRGRPKDDMAPLVQAIVPEVMALKPR